MNTSIDQTFYRVISGSGSIVKNGSGSLTASGNNMFSGTFVHASGVLVLQNANTLLQANLQATGTGNIVVRSGGGGDLKGKARIASFKNSGPTVIRIGD